MSTRKRAVTEDTVSPQVRKKTKTEPIELTPAPKSAAKSIRNVDKKNIDQAKSVDEFGVHAMKVPEIKDKLKERDLSTNGDKKVLSKRLIERLMKEKEPTYKPKPKGRFCKVCVEPALMQKRMGVRGPFFGCPNYPECTYTENRGGMAMLPKQKWFDINAPR